ncbi:MAG: hypothetical protein HN424_04540 [Candidatus Jacksonbacteria bacterium]|jgi:hypothetical protein|nr:hypothetical protein [Candidatus Jacksonbacteria bacterium]MBT7990064.1 hypothetical protein [Anaerolineae bacterium]
MSNDKKEGINWSKIALWIAIYLLFMWGADQYKQNQSLKEDVAIQTARSEYRAEDVAKTEEAYAKIGEDCISPSEAPLYVGTKQCVIGDMANYEYSNEPRDANTAPEFIYAFFRGYPQPNLILVAFGEQNVFLENYVGDCVMVWGTIQNTSENLAIPIFEDRYGDANIQRLDDDKCFP